MRYERSDEYAPSAPLAQAAVKSCGSLE